MVTEARRAEGVLTRPEERAGLLPWPLWGPTVQERARRVLTYARAVAEMVAEATAALAVGAVALAALLYLARLGS